ncbi:MAG: cyclic nucleotide-binding domain-containing protein [Chloroflexi bacterium]|nr:cyclic nucleotide-binding domain-containing protein [Chloroflexota bacterium]
MSEALTLEQAEMLTHVGLFAHLDRVALARLAACAEARAVGPGESVCREGDPADGLYVVSRGTFGVYLSGPSGIGETQVGVLGPGDSFGEMALLDDEPRSATVRAEASGEVLRLERSRFLDLLRKEPGVGYAIAVALSRLLRERDRVRMWGERARETGAEPRGTPTPAPPTRRSPRLGLGAGARRGIVTAVLAGGFGVMAVAVHALVGSPQWVFGLLMAAAVAMWTGQLLPDFAVALALVAAWVLLGVATPAQALAGFASMNWLFVVVVLAIAAAVARSGLMYRVGLLLVRRMPPGLVWQTATLLLTGLLLSPLLPSTMGRAALMAPLALAVAEARHLRDRDPGAAALGLAAWIGASPLAFAFLNASSLCLLAWGLLPEATRARFDWVQWLVAALPLTVLVSLGTLAMLFLVLRPKTDVGPFREGLQVQLAVLGPLSRREAAMVAVLLLTLIGWLLAPALGLDVALVGIAGLLLAVATGNLDRRALQELDWSFLLFFGVILSITGLVRSLGLDRASAEAVGPPLARLGLGPVGFVIALAVAGVLLEVLLGKTQTLLVLALALIPAAQALGVDPWVVVITLVAGPSMWFLPGQAPAYLVALAASEGRLYSPTQSRAVALGYTAVTLLAVVLSLPYWRLLGLV